MISRNVSDPRTSFDLIAEKDGRFVGWGFIWKLSEAEPMFGLVVADDHQGQGLGRRVADAVVAGADDMGIPQVHLTVVVDNSIAIHLYSSLGFVDTGGFVHTDGESYRRMVRQRPGTPIRT